MVESKSFLAALFDVSFSEFITTKLIKIIFVIGIVIAAIVALFFVIGAFVSFLSMFLSSGYGWNLSSLSSRSLKIQRSLQRSSNQKTSNSVVENIKLFIVLHLLSKRGRYNEF